MVGDYGCKYCDALGIEYDDKFRFSADNPTMRTTRQMAEYILELYDEKKIFHLRGAIDYSQLGFKHRIMMKMFHSMMLKKPESELTADAKAMLETYGKQVDFVDYDGLKPIIEIIEKTKSLSD